MIYNEVSAGVGLTATGCVLVATIRPSTAAFGVGDVAYNVQKARRGVLEKVVVKVVRPIRSRRSPAPGRVLYIDTFNGYWNERDLIALDTAKALVEAYWSKVAEDTAKLPPCKS